MDQFIFNTPEIEAYHTNLPTISIGFETQHFEC